jgi:hypothetical protein
LPVSVLDEYTAGMAHYEVIVGNVGRVYSGNNNMEAHKTWHHYVKLSKAGRSGRAAGESVVLMENGEIVREFEGEHGDTSRRVKHGGKITGYYVMKYGGGRYTSVGFYGTKAEADREVARIKLVGAWHGMPPKIEPAYQRAWGSADGRLGRRNSRGRFTRRG